MGKLTNHFNRKWKPIVMHFVYYNFCNIHKTLSVTPAMEAGLTKDVMTIEDIIRLTMPKRPPNPSTKYGRKRLRKEHYEWKDSLSPDERSKVDKDEAIYYIIIIGVIALIIFLASAQMDY